METVEIIVYLVIALIVGALVVMFIGGWDAKQTYADLKRVMRGGSPDDYEKVTSTELPAAIIRLWDGCGLGTTNMSKTVYVTDNVAINKTMLFAYFKAANLCKSLQSAENSCGAREDMLFDNTTAPVLLRMSCDPTQEKLIIQS